MIETSTIVIDRPAGSTHPRYSSIVYPLDYGYLVDTDGGDGSGVDVWLGRSGSRQLTAVACCVDLAKRDVELKLLLGCGDDEIETIRGFHDAGDQSVLILWPASD